MDFRLLGPLEVSEDDRPLELGGAKQRSLLAVLLLNGGDAVSTDRLIDTLWGESPPASALNSVHIYVSRLRKELGEERLLTQGRGYRLALEPGELDVERFERLLSEGRELRSRGDHARATERFQAALMLWRGSPLADVAFESFAQTEIARLDELRLAALEERIDADLALGRHAELVPELEALVRDHPLRERMRGQLMLALYRSGRQAEALDVYQEGRRLLSSELGLEPGPALRDLEHGILNQDPTLDSPAAIATRPAALRRRAPLLVAGAAALLLVGAVLYAGTRRGGSAGLASVRPGAVGVVDQGTSRIVAEIPVAGRPSRLATGLDRAIWVGNDDARTVSFLGRRTYQPTKVLASGGFPSDLAAGAGALWIIDGSSGVLRKVDPVYTTVVARIKVFPANPVYDASREGVDPVSVAAGLGSAWLTDGSSELVRVDPRSSRVVERIDLGTPLNGVAVGMGAVWAVSGQAATVFRLDGNGTGTGSIPIVSVPDFESPYPLSVRVGEGSVWVLNGNTATVTRIDPEQRTVLATISIGIDHAPRRLAVGGGAAWVANGDGTLSRIDADDNDVEVIPVGHRLEDVAVGDGVVFVTAGSGLSSSFGTGMVVSGTTVHALPTSSCSPIYYGGSGQPGYLIASDLPLQGVGRTAIAQMSQAVQYVLRRHGFRAGDYSVGYQSCDDSTAAAGGAAPEKCEANARAYAENPSVIGIVGTWNSFCSGIELPILNQAPEGPLVMISPANTYVGLTRGGPGAAPGEPDEYYPIGIRSYARVVAADDIQGAANAMLARRLGAKSVYVLAEDFGYGQAVGDSFAAAASRLGLRVVGATSVLPGIDPATVAAQIRAAGADAVFLGTGLSPSTIELVKGLRAGLPAGTRLLAPDGFSPPAALVQAVGPAAEGMTVSTAGLPTSRLPPAGKEFASAFRDAVGQTPYQWPVAAAQATEVLLAAIAKSDGTRASVTRELFKTKVEDGILGDFSIDRNGDTTAGAVTFYRIVHGTPQVFSVITPSPSLVR